VAASKPLSDEHHTRRSQIAVRRDRRSTTPRDAEELFFTVASALLRELGERLVGQAHIALAELIKNSYDADATLVELTVEEDEIVVTDNGHGMTYAAFRDFWMRIGSPHKEQLRFSPNGRPLTGSKGVGRLAAQFLAHEVAVETSTGPRRELLEASVDWDEAVDAGELTEARAFVERSRRNGAFAGASPHGTRLTLRNLKQEWDAEALELLGRELWPLRPPFRAAAAATDAFDIRLSSGLQDAEQTFETQMQAILSLWDGRITARLVPLKDDPNGRAGGPRTIRVSVELGDQTEHYDQVLNPCRLDALDLEIRVFDLRYRQPSGIRVSTAREYLNRFGGVHVYDAGFHLPYYGSDTDWLRIEIDHSHRVTRSKLLPNALQHPGALAFLPTNSRLWGVVHIDTGQERAAARKHKKSVRQALTIQVTRDRLVVNSAYRDLQRAVRLGLDLYAILEAKKHARELERLMPTEALPVRVERVEQVLERHREEIPPPVYQALSTQIREVVESVQSEAEITARQAGLLGALATAGISAVAFEHEFNRQLGALERSARRLRAAIKGGDMTAVENLGDELSRQLEQARHTRRLFGSLLDEEDRTRRISPRARALFEEVLDMIGPFAAGVKADFDELGDVRLPAGTQAEWSALWQNLMVNAVNAMLDRGDPMFRATHRVRGKIHAIALEDTGSGVDLDRAEELFEPFYRAMDISRERRNLGFGGTGLGLTIVRMLADSLGCKVRFVPPSEGFSTAVQVSWSER